ncbi:MAG TPA: response regulator [Methylomirabilota bacterium]|jgi:CheY-like chemotaxis protein|nr:response regulator [Methylomirabilota bacterium]
MVENSGGAKLSILIVEDDPDALEALGDLLESHGYAVASAHHGAEALELLGRSPLPNLIVLDLLMPTMDGWEFRRRQKLDPRIAKIPVVVVSASSAAKPIDADSILRKPVDIDRLLETVARHCG